MNENDYTWLIAIPLLAIWIVLIDYYARWRYNRIKEWEER